MLNEGVSEKPEVDISFLGLVTKKKISTESLTTWPLPTDEVSLVVTTLKVFKLSVILSSFRKESECEDVDRRFKSQKEFVLSDPFFMIWAS